MRDSRLPKVKLKLKAPKMKRPIYLVKKKSKVDWVKFWKAFDRWYLDGEGIPIYAHAICEIQREKIEKLVETQLRRK